MKDPQIQGTHILGSYLTALKIPFSRGSVDHELIVTTKKGSFLPVKVIEAARATAESFGGVVINPNEISSFKLESALKELHTVTIAAGYGKPLPVDRGPVPSNINYLDNFEDIYLRHSIFRRSPNRTPDELQPYMRAIKLTARKASFRWKTVFNAMGFAESDLINVGMVYTLSFMHNYATSQTQSENIKLLCEFLNQRFGEFAKITYKKALSATCLPQNLKQEMGDEWLFDTFAESPDARADEEYEEENFTITFQDGRTAQLSMKNDGMLGLRMIVDGRELTPMESTQLTQDLRNGKVQKEYLPTDDVPTDMKVLRKLVHGLTGKIRRGDSAAEELHRLLPDMDENSRKKMAKRILYARLDSLEPEQRQTLLGYAVLARDYCPDARQEARRLADQLACPKCKKNVYCGISCPSCDTKLVSRFNVDYTTFRQQLLDDHHSLIDSMSTIMDLELRPKPEYHESSLTKDEQKALAEKMRQEEFSALPEFILCPSCKNTLPKAQFGVRVARNKASGVPYRASRQSYCKACRRSK